MGDFSTERHTNSTLSQLPLQINIIIMSSSWIHVKETLASVPFFLNGKVPQSALQK